MTVERHINSVYVGTIIRLLGSSSNTKGRLAIAYWADKRGVFVTYQNKEISTILDLRDKTFVVDHRDVRSGSFQLFKKFGTNDMDVEPVKKKPLKRSSNRIEEY